MEWDSEAILVELRLEAAWPDLVVDRAQQRLRDALDRILNLLPATTSRNIEVQANLKVFIDDSLYLTKPLTKRYWLASAALNDADEIAGDLLVAQQRTSPEVKHDKDATQREKAARRRLEDPITRNLIRHARMVPHLRVRFYDTDLARDCDPLGYIDLAVLFSIDLDEVCLAIECKRLNVNGASLAAE